VKDDGALPSLDIELGKQIHQQQSSSHCFSEVNGKTKNLSLVDVSAKEIFERFLDVFERPAAAAPKK
jgi:hypothetical protein